MKYRTIEDPKQLIGLGGLTELSDYAHAIVAENDEGEIVGYWVYQLVVCAEPVWVREDHRGGMVVKRMHNALLSVLKEDGVLGYFIHASTEKIGEYIERIGLKATGWMAYLGEVK